MRFAFSFLIFNLTFQGAFAADETCDHILSVGRHHIVGDYTIEKAKFADQGKTIVSVAVAADESTHPFLTVARSNSKTSKIVDPFASKRYPGTEVQISADSQYACFTPPTKYASHPILYQVETDQFHHLKQFAKAKRVDILNGSKFVVAKLADHSLGIYNIETRVTQTVFTFNDGWNYTQLGSSSRLLLNSENGYARILNLETLEQKPLQLSHRVTRIQNSIDGQRILLFGKFNELEESIYFYDLTQGNNIEVKLKNPASVELLKDGRAILYTQKTTPSTLRLFDLNGNTETILTENYGMGWDDSSYGQKVLIRNADKSLSLYDRLLGQSQTIDLGKNAEAIHFGFMGADNGQAYVQFQRDGQSYFTIYDFATHKPLKTYSIPFNAEPTLAPDQKRILFYFPDAEAFEGGSSLLFELEELASLDPKTRIPNSGVTKYFSKLAKPGAFKLKQHAQSVYWFFESGQFKRNKGLAQKILINVLSESVGMYESIIGRYPEFSGDGFYFKEKPTATLPVRWKNTIRDYMNYFNLTRANSRAIVDSLKYVKALSHFMELLPFDQRAFYADMIAEPLADAALVEFPVFFKSDMYRICEETSDPIVGIPRQLTSNVVLIPSPYRLDPYLLGTSPIYGDASTWTPYGFYVKKLDPILIPKDAKKGDIILNHRILRWTQDKDVIQAEMDAVVSGESIDEVTPPIAKFNYKRLWEDKSLTGMVVIGANLVGEEKSIIAAYRQYFEKAGFEFDSESERTTDLRAYFKSKIESGEVDYFIKEAHSDGDDRNLFRIHTDAKILKATARRANGFKETIYITIPRPSGTTLIESQEWTDWIHTREKDSKPPLVYLNAGCWSVGKMIADIQNVFSKGLVEIASTTPSYMFESDERNAEYQFLTHFRAGRTMQTIRKYLRKNPEYVHGIGNNFIFPDEASYRSLLGERAKPPLRVRVKLTKNGKPYTIDE